MPIPELLPIRYMDDLHTAFVGRCRDGKQFFLNELWVYREPLSEDWLENRDECLVLYLFDSEGNYLSHQFWNGGSSKVCTQESLANMRHLMLASLEPCTFCDIAVKLFSIEIEGTTFGLIQHPDPDWEAVHLEPGCQISFAEPWDGEYYT